MCGPLMGMMGGMVSAIGSIAQGNAQAASLKAQAAFNRRQGSMEYVKGSYDISMQKRQEERLLGTQAAGFAKGGITPESGSPAELALSTDKEADMDRQAIRFGRDVTVSNYNYKAKINEMEAKQAKTAGIFGAISGLLSSATKLGSGFQTA